MSRKKPAAEFGWHMRKPLRGPHTIPFIRAQMSSGKWKEITDLFGLVPGTRIEWINSYGQVTKRRRAQ